MTFHPAVRVVLRLGLVQHVVGARPRHLTVVLDALVQHTLVPAALLLFLLFEALVLVVLQPHAGELLKLLKKFEALVLVVLQTPKIEKIN